MVVIGLLIGGGLPFVVAAMTMTSVGKAAGDMVVEIRRQFKEIPGLLEGKEGVKPDSQTCVDISTKAALVRWSAPVWWPLCSRSSATVWATMPWAVCSQGPW